MINNYYNKHYNKQKIYYSANRNQELYAEMIEKNLNLYIGALRCWIRTDYEINQYIEDRLDKYGKRYAEPYLHKDAIISHTAKDTIDTIINKELGSIDSTDHSRIFEVIRMIYTELVHYERFTKGEVDFDTFYSDIIGSNILYDELFDIIYDSIEDYFDDFFFI